MQYLHVAHAEPVFGVRLLRDVPGEQGREAGGIRDGRDLVGPAVDKRDPGLPHRSRSDSGRDSRKRYYRAREHSLTEQGVQERALAALELAERGQVKAALVVAAGECLEAVGGGREVRAEGADDGNKPIEVGRE